MAATSPTYEKRPPLVGLPGFVVAGMAPAAAALFSNPLDVARVRMQLNAELGTARAYRHTGDAIAKVYRAEGLRGAQAGLKTAMVREAMQNVPRLGLYLPLMQAWDSLDGTPDGTPAAFYKRLVVGGLCGIAGGVFSNPAEIIKARVQSGRYDYKGPFNGARRVVQAEGVVGLFKGGQASAWRCMVGTSSQMVSFTYALDALKATHWYRTTDMNMFTRDFAVNAVAGLWSGVFLSVCMQPLDTCRTRLYGQPFDPVTRRGTLYTSLLDCMVKTARAEGVSGLYKGLMGNVARQGPHMVLVFAFKSVLENAYGQTFLRPAEVESSWQAVMCSASGGSDSGAGDSASVDDVAAFLAAEASGVDDATVTDAELRLARVLCSDDDSSLQAAAPAATGLPRARFESLVREVNFASPRNVAVHLRHVADSGSDDRDAYEAS